MNHLEGVSSRWTFAGVAPSDRIIMSGGTTGLEMLEEALANWPMLESTWEGGPQPALTPNVVRYRGTLPRTMLNTFYSNAQAFGSLMLIPMLRTNEFIHTWSGSIQRDTRISLAIRDATSYPSSAQCPDGTDHHGSTIRGREGRTPPRTNRHGSTIRGAESQTSPTTNHGSTNHCSRTLLKCKLPLKRTNPLPTSKKKPTMTPSKMIPTMEPTTMTKRVIRTPRRVGRAHAQLRLRSSTRAAVSATSYGAILI